MGVRLKRLKKSVSQEDFECCIDDCGDVEGRDDGERDDECFEIVSVAGLAPARGFGGDPCVEHGKHGIFAVAVQVW